MNPSFPRSSDWASVYLLLYCHEGFSEGMLISCYSGFFLARVHVVKLRPKVSAVRDIGGERIYTNGGTDQIWKQLHVSMLGAHRCQRFSEVSSLIETDKLHRTRSPLRITVCIYSFRGGASG